MKLAIDLDSLVFVNPINPTVATREVSMRRDDVLPIELIFFKNGDRHELAEDVIGSIQLNAKDVFGGSGLTSDSSFAKVGSGIDSVYHFDLDLTSADIDTAFSNDSEPASILASLELKLSDSVHTQRTQLLPVTIQNAISQP